MNLPGLDFQLGADVDALRDAVRDFAQTEIARRTHRALLFQQTHQRGHIRHRPGQGQRITRTDDDDQWNCKKTHADAVTRIHCRCQRIADSTRKHG